MLGPLEVRTDGDPGETLEVGGVRLRALLIMLALRPGQFVPASQLIDGLWAEAAPAGAANALQALVSRLRRALPDAVIESRPAGYQLALDPQATDIVRFEQLAAAGRAQLREDPAAAAATLDAGARVCGAARRWSTSPRPTSAGPPRPARRAAPGHPGTPHRRRPADAGPAACRGAGRRARGPGHRPPDARAAGRAADARPGRLRAARRRPRGVRADQAAAGGATGRGALGRAGARCTWRSCAPTSPPRATASPPRPGPPAPARPRRPRTCAPRSPASSVATPSSPRSPNSFARTACSPSPARAARARPAWRSRRPGPRWTTCPTGCGWSSWPP